MRGNDEQQAAMFSYVSPEQRVPTDHPLRPVRAMADQALRELNRRLAKLYSPIGRPSIAPEKLLRALLLQLLYSVRSERMLMEQLDYNLLFRWFVGLNMDDRVWDATVFSQNRDRLLEGDVAQAFFDAVVRQARAAGLMSDEHFSVDGTLIEAWAGQKSLRSTEGRDEPPADGGRNPEVNFHGQRRSNDTHVSKTDPEAMLARKSKGRESKLCYAGHLLTENRNGLVARAELTHAYGNAETHAALLMIERIEGGHVITVGGDKGFDNREFVGEARGMRARPHVAAKKSGGAVDARTTRHGSYGISQRKRKRIEEVFAWIKTVALLRKTRHRGRERVKWMFVFAAAAYNLVRMRKLRAACA
ncbi:MAG: IS5 family transposase [Terriglobales bacterium]